MGIFCDGIFGDGGGDVDGTGDGAGAGGCTHVDQTSIIMLGLNTLIFFFPFFVE